MAATSISVFDSTATARSLATVTDNLGNQTYLMSPDSTLAHYVASKSQLVPVATPTAAFVIAGSGSKTVRIKKIILNGSATAAASMEFQVKKNSSAGILSGAVLTALPAVPLDIQNTAASAIVSSVGTANYGTLPTLVGPVYSGALPLGAIGGSGFSPLTLTFGSEGTQALVLRGTTDVVTIDFLGSALPAGGKVDIVVIWSEDNS